MLRRSLALLRRRPRPLIVALNVVVVLFGILHNPTPPYVYTKMAVNDTVNIALLAIEFRSTHAHRCPRDTDELVQAGLLKRRHLDPWGNDLVLECTHEWLSVCSPGPDESDPADDICDVKYTPR